MKVNRVLIIGLITGFFLFLLNTCEAVLIEGYATGDNIFWVWSYDGSGGWNSGRWYPSGGWNDWTTSHYIYGDTTMGEVKDLYVAVKDIGLAAGFLADIKTSSGYFQETGTNKLLTDISHWEIIGHSGWTEDPTFDPTTLSGWTTPTSYGTNESNLHWMASSPIANIDNSAQWIWTNGNGKEEDYAVLHTRFTVIPEIGTMILLGSLVVGLFGVFGIRRKFSRR